MKPTPFAEANGTLTGGPARDYNTKLDVADLPVFRDGRKIISCWRLSLPERLAVLFLGRVWLHVASGTTHAPVYVGARRPFVATEGSR